MGWIKYAVGFCIGIGLYHNLDYIYRDYQTGNCGTMKGYTTHVILDKGLEICVWRQNSYPYKTISGIKV